MAETEFEHYRKRWDKETERLRAELELCREREQRLREALKSWFSLWDEGADYHVEDEQSEDVVYAHLAMTSRVLAEPHEEGAQ